MHLDIRQTQNSSDTNVLYRDQTGPCLVDQGLDEMFTAGCAETPLHMFAAEAVCSTHSAAYAALSRLSNNPVDHNGRRA